MKCMTLSQCQNDVCMMCQQHIDVLTMLEHFMCPWKGGTIQKSIFSKRLVDCKNSTVNDSIFLFVQKLYLYDQYNKIFIRPSSQWSFVKIIKAFKEFCSFFRKQRATQQIVAGSFSFDTINA